MPANDYDDIKQEDIRHKSTVESGIRLVKAKIAKIEQLAELKALEDKLSLLAKSNASDRHVQAESGEAGRLLDELRQTLTGSFEHDAASVRAQSPESDHRRDSCGKRQRYQTPHSDFVRSDSVRSSPVTARKHSVKVPHKRGLQPEDMKWLQQNAEKYRGLGQAADSISWRHLLAENKDLAARVTATQCAAAWSNLQRTDTKQAYLEPKDIQWLHKNAERFRGVGTHKERISWGHLLKHNKDLGRRMSLNTCAQAWARQLQKEKAQRSGKRDRPIKKDPDPETDSDGDNDIEL